MFFPFQILYSARILRGKRPWLLPEAEQIHSREGGAVHHLADGQRPQVSQWNQTTCDSLRPQTRWDVRWLKNFFKVDQAPGAIKLRQAHFGSQSHFSALCSLLKSETEVCTYIWVICCIFHSHQCVNPIFNREHSPGEWVGQWGDQDHGLRPQ